ncbi:MAG: alcohol dehydrogenase catalytic domain-containing protein [Acidimicrobiia bacterium]|nr:alcohol dehydrogenase catalytic domain-containing protein [Acidimicrobiia bacterium]
MRALRFHGPGELRLEDVADPRPSPDTVVISVMACGVCGSDLHFLDGTARTGHVPITLGHEIAGVIDDPASSGLRPGIAVVVTVGASCGSCRRCSEGRPNLCESATVIGIHADGGLADAVSVPVAAVVPIPTGVEPAAAATAVDAGATALHAVTRTAALQPGETVLVIGLGGLGTYAAQIARNLGAARVIAADIDPAALDRAALLGADDCVLVEAGGSLGRSVKMLTDGGVDVALEFVGRAATVDAAVKSIRPGGRAVAVGVGPEPLVTLPPVLWSNFEYTLRGSYGSLPGDTERVLAGLADGSLQSPPLARATLAEAADAILSLSRGESPAMGRLMVIP